MSYICMDSLIISLHGNVNNSKFIKKIPLNFDQHPPPLNIVITFPPTFKVPAMNYCNIIPRLYYYIHALWPNMMHGLQELKYWPPTPEPTVTLWPTKVMQWLSPYPWGVWRSHWGVMGWTVSSLCHPFLTGRRGQCSAWDSGDWTR